MSRQRQSSSIVFRFFLKFSSVVFRVKQKILQSESFFVRIFFAFVLLFLEIAFAILSLPLYFSASPDTFEKQISDTSGVRSYSFRRRVSLGTILGAGGMYAAKVLVVTAISFFLIGAPTLLADTQTWTFATPSDYTYDNAKLEITGGVAQLKDIGVPTTGATTNPSFTTNATGWTYADWLDPGQATAAGAWQNSGGNTGGYVNLSLNATAGTRTIAGLWRQSFTTTVANPDTATLTFDRKIFTYTSPTAPVTYQLYAFIDTASGNPTLGQQVWSSGEITATSAWISVPAIDIRTKVAAAGTYYVKVVAYVTTPAPNTTYSYVAGLDNIQVSWSKANVAYDTSVPSLYPNTSLNPTQVLSWTSFTETATKGGELYYQLSDDDGATWKYWNGSTWAAAGASNYTTAATVNTYISSFPLTNNKIRWKAFFSSNGTQQNILNNIAIGYTQNTTPSLTGLSGAQQSNTGRVNVDYTLVDTESDTLNLNTYEYSTNGSTWNTMTAATGDPAHDGISGLTSSPGGVAHTFVWNAYADLGAISSSSVQVRLRPNDGITNGTLVTSSTFSVDYVIPVVSNVSASESTGSTNVIVTYDLSDASTSGLFVELEASADGGSNWTVATTSATGAVGSGVSAGTGKSITWNAGADYSGHQLDTMKVRVRAKDTYQNQGTFANSSNFSLDTLAPAVLAGADLQSQPHAGESAVTVSGTFTEANPNTNLFYVANGSGVYGSSTAGSSGTATPPAQAVTTAVLDGNDYITKVKVVHTDTHGLSTTNENTSPTLAYKYVKPYTPLAPTVTSPGAAALNIVVNKNASEVTGLEYAIYETSTNQYVQANETLGASPVWQTIAVWSTVNLTSLPSPLANYSFETKSRNSNDGAHAASSESALSSAASIANTAPSITINTIDQAVGASYIAISYTGEDAQGDTSSLVAYEYSTNGSTWNTMTEKSGVGSSGKTNLPFSPAGASLLYAWDAATDIPGVEIDTVSVRLQANDGLINGNMATSSTFMVDTVGPVVSNVSATQPAGNTNVTITYDLAEQSSTDINVTLEVSSNSGSSWVVPSTSATGAVGSGVSAGVGKTITWDAGTDYSGHQLNTMQVRVRGRDMYFNQGSFVASSDFSLDTLAPAVLAGADLQSQPHAGDTSATVSGTFTEVNPSTNQFYVALDGGAYGSATSGDSSTATPSPQAVTTAALNGSNYISKVKVVHTDTHGLSTTNENTSPALAYKYVKPYTPPSPTVTTPGSGALDVSVNKHASEATGLSYAIYDTSTSKYVQADSTLGTSAVWQTIAVWSTVHLTSLPNPIGSYAFETKSRNSQDGAHAASSESDFSSAASVGNTAPSIALGTVSQPAGASYIEINYTGTDAQGDAATLLTTEYSTNGTVWNTMTEKSGVGSNGKTGLAFTPSGASLMFAWDAATDIPGVEIDTVSIRLQAHDGIVDGNMATSSTFAVDTRGPVVTNVSASQGLHSTLVAITYDLADQSSTGLNVTLEISSNSGSSWVVPSTSATGAVGGGVTAGTGKTISWNAGTDYSGHQLSTMQVRVRAKDTYENQGSFLASSDFGLDTLAPTVLAGSNLDSRPSAGDTSVTVSGTFTEANPDTNQFYVALNGGAYGSATAGASGTATPSPQAVTTAALNGSNYISKVKVVHTDLYGQSATNENTSPTVAYIYVKPYTPPAPTVTSPGAGALDVVVNKHASEVAGLEYAIYETSTSKYVQADNTLGTNAVWQTIAVWSTVNLTSLPNPLVNYSFETKSRNNNDGAHAASSESALSSAASIANTAPSITLGVIERPAGTSYVRIAYTGTDAQSDTSSLVAYDYSTNGSTWSAMTEKSGVGSSGKTGLAFTPSGASLVFAWDIATDLPNTESGTVTIRLRANDGMIDGNTATSSEFTVDTRAPVVSNVSAVQTVGTTNVAITYDLSDISTSGLLVELEISANSGSSWVVPSTSATGAVGSGVSAGAGKTITWNAGADYSGHQLSTMQVRVRAKDTYDHQGSFVASSDFSLDTVAPVVLAGAQLDSQPNAGDTNVTISGTFTEVNPGTNQFYVALGSGVYSSATNGASGTATPSPQATATGTTLAGDDYITKVKVVHTDTYGQSVNNENTSPTVAYIYVKPYTPLAPTVVASGPSSLSVTVNKHLSEVDGLSYAIYETSTHQYVQADNTLGISAVWQPIAVWSTVTISGLPNPLENYSFETKSRNTNDGLHASTSESNLSSAASVGNTAPSIVLGAIEQPVGMSYITIAYTGTDAQGDTSSLVTAEYSADGSTWHSMTEKSGVGSNGKTGLAFSPSGRSLMFAWDAATDLPGTELTGALIRLQPNDGTISGNTATSTGFPVDTKGPVVSNVSASQSVGSTLFAITYDLADQTTSGINVTMEISGDGGSSWVVPTTSATGAIGAGVSAGTGKTITWNASADYLGNQSSVMQVRVRGKDTYENQGSFVPSSNFTLDTLAPSVLAGANLTSQPHAGNTTATISGTFTEANPNTNDFYVALGSGVYGSATSGASGTATPSAQATATGATLNGSDVVTKVKVVHTDTYGQSIENENTSPTAAYAYVKPYTPATPTVITPGAESLSVTVNKHTSEVDGLEYAIYETSTGQYVQADSTLGGTTVWQTISTWSTVTIVGLLNPLENYSFETKSRNSSDGSHAVTSESDFSPAASIANTAPTIALGAIEQPVGMSYVTIAYTGTDPESNIASLVAADYSTDGSTWIAMTEKSGVGSNGRAGLSFTPGGASLMFAWNISTDLPGAELSNVYVRLRANDGVIDGNTATSSSFSIDTRAPVVSAVSATQNAGSGLVTISYNLVDQTSSTLNVVLEISDDNGSTWAVPTTSASGAVGTGVTTGVGKTITWNAGTNYSNHYNSSMLVRLTATDSFANAAAPVSSSVFTIDTKTPVIATLTASQVAATDNVTIGYDLSDDTATGLTVTVETSPDGGTTWTAATTLSGNAGGGQSTGTSKLATWNAGTDLPNTETSRMAVRVKTSDAFGNESAFVESSQFVLDTASPVGPTTFSAPTTTETSATFSWSSSADAHFGYYEIWYGTSAGDVNARSGTAQKWSVAQDSTLNTPATSSTSIAGLTSGGTYVVKIWAVDTFGHDTSPSDITITLPSPPVVVPPSAGGGTGTSFAPPTLAKPIVNPLPAFSRQTSFDVSGNAGTLSRVDIYDNGVFLKSITSSSAGVFQDSFTFQEGGHSLTAKAIDQQSATSDFSDPVAFVIDVTPPRAPEITAPVADQSIAPGEFLVTGSAEISSTVDIVVDNTATFFATTGTDGLWNAKIPTTSAQTLGTHRLSVTALDRAGNTSPATNLTIRRVQTAPTLPTEITTVPVTTPVITPTVAPVTPVVPAVPVVPTPGVPSPVAAPAGGVTPTPAPGVTPTAPAPAPAPTPTVTPVAPAPVVPSLPVTPAVAQNVLEAVELPALPVPQILSVRAESLSVATGTVAGGVTPAAPEDLLRFSGNAIPNQDVMVYIHSDQALVYRVKADRTGAWALDHSQTALELTPGEHTIYAVSVNPDIQVKSPPSPIHRFTVTRNFWSMMYRRLDIYSTSLTILALLSMMAWLYQIQQKRRVA